MNLWARFQCLLHKIYTTPSVLKGSGSAHEASFERLLHHHGILSHSRIGYERYPNGPQRWPDFHLYDERAYLPVELKTTSRMTVSMGKSWIQGEALYLIHHRPTNSIYLSWGKDMKTEEDDRRFREFQQHVRSMNSGRQFTPLVQWTATTQVLYRLEPSRRSMMYEKVMEELRQMARR